MRCSPEGVYVDQSLYCMVDSNRPESTELTPLPSLELRVFEGELKKLELSVGDESCAPLVPENSRPKGRIFSTREGRHESSRYRPSIKGRYGSTVFGECKSSLNQTDGKYTHSRRQSWSRDRS